MYCISTLYACLLPVRGYVDFNGVAQHFPHPIASVRWCVTALWSRVQVRRTVSYTAQMSNGRQISRTASQSSLTYRPPSRGASSHDLLELVAPQSALFQATQTNKQVMSILHLAASSNRGALDSWHSQSFSSPSNIVHMPPSVGGAEPTSSAHSVSAQMMAHGMSQDELSLRLYHASGTGQSSASFNVASSGQNAMLSSSATTNAMSTLDIMHSTLSSIGSNKRPASLRMQVG